MKISEETFPKTSEILEVFGKTSGSIPKNFQNFGMFPKFSTLIIAEPTKKNKYLACVIGVSDKRVE